MSVRIRLWLAVPWWGALGCSDLPVFPLPEQVDAGRHSLPSDAGHDAATAPPPDAGADAGADAAQ